MTVRQLAVIPLALILGAHNLAVAQQAASGPARSGGAPGLRIIVLEGEGAVNHIPTRAATAPVVEIRDQNDQPVEGALVVFQLPDSGPGGTFAGGERLHKSVTDARGQAGTRGLVINEQAGRYTIKVTATFQDLANTAMISQANSVKARAVTASRGRSKWVWILIAAGAGAGGAVYYTQSRNSSGPPVSASMGPVVVSAPR
jgi:hypothetical protein